MQRIVGYARPYLGRLALITILVAVMALVGQVPPFVMKAITDVLVQPDGARNASYFMILLSALLAGTISIALLNRATWHLTNLFAVRMEIRLKEIGFDQLMRLSMRFFTDEASGELMSKLDRGVNRIVAIINNSGMYFVPNMATAIVSFGFVAQHSWQVAVSILIAFIPYVLINRWRFNKNRSLELEEYRLYDRQYSHFFEVLGNMSFVKAFRSEDYERNKFKTFHKRYEEIRKGMEVNTNKAVIGDLVLEIWQWSAYAFVAWQTWLGRNSVGDMVFLVGMLELIRRPLWQLNWIFWEVKRAGLGAKSFFKIMDAQPDVSDPAKAVKLSDPVQGTFEINDVSFTHTPAKLKDDDEYEDDKKEPEPETKGTQVFKNLSLTIPAGKSTALVGPSGAGKTTLAALLLRFYDPESGTISIDGIDLRDIKQSDLRKHFGYVSQDAALFATTVAENLKYAKPDATDDEMWRALKLASADDFVEKMAQGLNTKIGDRGVRLSGGQKQRLSLARVILRDPKIIILDEATSALDSESELKIQKALQQLLIGRTSVVIAHRLSTIQRADQIVVLKDGGVLESGTHSQLLKTDGLYASLFKIQRGDVAKLAEWDLVA